MRRTLLTTPEDSPVAIDFNKVPKYIRDELEKGEKPIESGQSGMRVRRVQEWLRYHECRTSIDESYGPATVACVKDFQKLAKLPQTGVVDDATWQALVRPMREALAEPKGIKSLSPQQTVRKVAEQHLKQHPVEIGGDNRGPWVRLYCEGNDGRAWAWCAGMVSLVMQQAFFYREESAPIRGSVSCDSLAAQGKAAGMFVPEADVTKGKFAWKDFGGCCIFLLRRTDTDWVHAGFALDGSGTTAQTVFVTIEGNTNDEGSREGFEACRRTRGVAGGDYDFVRLA
jgi:hypothetical protein